MSNQFELQNHVKFEVVIIIIINKILNKKYFFNNIITLMFELFLKRESGIS
jgi:hypothetical protein